MDQELINLITAGGGTGTVLLLAVIVKKLWRSASAEIVATKEDGAKIDLITSLASDIDRLKTELTEAKEQHRLDIQEIKQSNKRDIDEIKDLHKKEKDELFKKIRQLNEKIDKLKGRHEVIRTNALEVYTFLSENEHCTKCTQQVEELKKSLLNIIVSDNWDTSK